MIGPYIEVNDGGLDAFLADLWGRLDDLTPAMRAISMVLLSQDEANFGAESGPLGKWPDLAASTKDARTKRGTWPGRILQESGIMAASVHPFFDANEAGIGTNAIQAAIQQLGGKAGRNHVVTIKPRPYMPVLPDGQLQDGTVEQIFGALAKYIQTGDS